MCAGYTAMVETSGSSQLTNWQLGQDVYSAAQCYSLCDQYYLDGLCSAAVWYITTCYLVCCLLLEPFWMITMLA